MGPGEKERLTGTLDRDDWVGRSATSVGVREKQKADGDEKSLWQ